MGSLLCGETYETSPIPRSSRSVSEKVREEKNGLVKHHGKYKLN